jgi:hypothetical protein
MGGIGSPLGEATPMVGKANVLQRKPPPEFILDLILSEGKDRLAATMVDPGAIHSLTTAAKGGDISAHRMLAEIRRALVGVREQRPEAICVLCLAVIPSASCVGSFAMIHAAVAQPVHVLGLLVCEACPQRHPSQAALTNALRARYRAELGVELGRVPWIEQGEKAGEEAAAVIA